MTFLQLHDYDSTHIPAIPVVDVVVGKLGSDVIETVVAIVDSGSDGSLLPLSVLQRLNVKSSRKAWMRGLTGQPVLLKLYRVTIQLGNHRPVVVFAGGTENKADAIIGRDVLNQFVVTLNGPAHSVEIYD